MYVYVSVCVLCMCVFAYVRMIYDNRKCFLGRKVIVQNICYKAVVTSYSHKLQESNVVNVFKV